MAKLTVAGPGLKRWRLTGSVIPLAAVAGVLGLLQFVLTSEALAQAPAQPSRPSIYTCTTSDGRRLTSAKAEALVYRNP